MVTEQHLNDNYLLQDKETGNTRRDHVNNLKALPFVAQLYKKAEGEHEEPEVVESQQSKDDKRMRREREEREEQDDDGGPILAPAAQGIPAPVAHFFSASATAWSKTSCGSSK